MSAEWLIALIVLGLVGVPITLSLIERGGGERHISTTMLWLSRTVRGVTYILSAGLVFYAAFFRTWLEIPLGDNRDLAIVGILLTALLTWIFGRGLAEALSPLDKLPDDSLSSPQPKLLGKISPSIGALLRHGSRRRTPVSDRRSRKR